MITYILANKGECGFYFPERTQGNFFKNGIPESNSYCVSYLIQIKKLLAK